jgi:hypothetical protein
VLSDRAHPREVDSCFLALAISIRIRGVQEARTQLITFIPKRTHTVPTSDWAYPRYILDVISPLHTVRTAPQSLHVLAVLAGPGVVCPPVFEANLLCTCQDVIRVSVLEMTAASPVDHRVVWSAIDTYPVLKLRSIHLTKS